MIFKKRLKCYASILAVVISLMTTVSSTVFAETITNISEDILNAKSSKTITVPAYSSYMVSTTTKLSKLIIERGASITAPEGYSVTLTVNGVGKEIKPGTYTGNVVLNVTKQNVVEYKMANLTHYFKQALYVDSNGVVKDKSVLSMITEGKVTNNSAENIKITSEEQNFNGIYVSGGTYSINGAKIDLTGNGGNDFAGYGAAIMSTGEGTKVVVNNSEIKTNGAIRPAIIAAGGSNMIVKNSRISTQNGILPSNYIPNVQIGLMKTAPWMLGIIGNCRATNVLGENTTSTYINSSISAEGWGVLSTDDCRNIKLTAINSDISITGESGYGAYSIGDGVDSFYGSTITVPDYALIITGGNGVFAASTRENINMLNNTLNLGLTSKELNSIKEKQTTVKSGRFGVMWHGNGSLKIADGTTFDTRKTLFLVKGASANIDVDGSKGAQLKSGNGVILQLMDNDDPGPVMVNGMLLNIGVYSEPTEPATEDTTHNKTVVTEGKDTIAKFSNIELNGNFYNSTRGGIVKNIFGMPENASKNLCLKFDNSKITGVISSTTAKHAKDTIDARDYKELGEVTNTPSAAVNNGVIVFLTNGSTWVVNGKCYLTSLTIENGSKVIAPEGYKVTMTVNGVQTDITAGTYTGEIELTVTPNN